MHFIIGTAGHVDHGKTTLIRALTGIETDRLREEKERGLSIVPGFAHLTLPAIENVPERIVGIVDVPGHERFLKNMLSGVTGIDIALLIIAADEGVMPQTTEHLRILELLQIRAGVVVLTKCDAVEKEWLALVRLEVGEKLKDTLFAPAPLREVSAQSGAGLGELKNELAKICRNLEIVQNPKLSPRPFRMAIDRAFSISGFGTVVTGSAAQGALSVGESVDVWQTGSERALTARVRTIEVHGEAAQNVSRGQRTAVNLAGVDLDDATRGGTLAAPKTLRAVTQIETWLRLVPDAPRPIKDKSPLRFHLGTAELEARTHLFEATRLLAGESGFARLRFAAPLTCARGDRFVLREVGTERVVGGGLILDLATNFSRAESLPWLTPLCEAVESDDQSALAEILLHRANFVGLSEAQLQLELNATSVKEILQSLEESGVLWRAMPESGDEILLHQQSAAALQKNILQALSAFHQSEPLAPFLSREMLRAALPTSLSQNAFEALLFSMQNAKIIALEASGVRLWAHRVTLSEDETRLKNQLVQTAHKAAWQALTISELVEECATSQRDFANQRDLAKKLCFALIKENKLVRADDFVFSRERLDEGAQILTAHLQKNGTLAISEARDLLNTTRKWLVPLLEYYDRSGLTRRDGDKRVLR